MRILLVEDHAALRELTSAHLAARGFVVDEVGGVEEARAAMASMRYDALVVDLGLPDGDGAELIARQGRAAKLRGEAPVPALILTARDSLEDRLAGLNGGADDYLVKPFRVEELEARLRAVLRRPGARIDRVLTLGDLSLDTITREVRVGESAWPLARREALLLEALLLAHGRLVVRDDLGDRLYGSEQAVTPNALEMVVSRLRRALVDAGAAVRVETQRGGGVPDRPVPAILMLSSLRWRLAAALALVLVLGATAMSVFSALQSQTPDELIEETSLSSQARETLRGIEPGQDGGVARIASHGGWEAAYRIPNTAFFTLYDADGRERARSPNLHAPLPDFPIPQGAAHSRLALTGADQVLTQSVRAPGGGRLVVGRVNPESRVEPASDRWLDAAPVLTVSAMLALAILLVAIVTGWSLRPLKRAAAEAAHIGPRRPQARLSTEGMPSEVLPLADAVNRALKRVAEAYESEKRFTADAAHALRTPLTVLDLRLQRLEAGESVATDHLRADVDEIIRIVTGLLLLARGDRTPSPAETATTNLARVLREAAADLAPLLEHANRGLTLTAPDVAVVPGDPGIWRDGVGALLDNALLHGAGRVNASLRHAASGVVLTVSDEGAGVPAALREQVFERFHKIDGSTRGAGLGLAIIRQAARRYGGDIGFVDATTIELRLPAQTQSRSPS